MAQGPDLNKCKWKATTNKSLRSCTLLLIFLLISTCFGSELDNDIQSGVGVVNVSDFDPENLSYAKVQVRKCCPFGQYFDISRGKCAASGKLWSTGNQSAFVNESNAVWLPHFKFWGYYSSVQPVLTFDSKLVGMPYCSTGKEEDIESVAVEMPEVEWDPYNATAGSWNWNNETNYFFKPGVPMLMEVSPGAPYTETYHNPEQFCVDLTETDLILRYCRCSEEQPCIRKCCPLGFSLRLIVTMGDMVCEESAGAGGSSLPLHSKPGVKLRKEELQGLQPRYVVNFPQCHFVVVSSGWSTVDVVQKAFVIDQRGQPHFYDQNKQEWAAEVTSDYCVDIIEEDPPVHQVCSGEEEGMIYCVGEAGQNSAEPNPESLSGEFYSFYIFALVVATIALLLTAIVLCLLLERKNIHSWTRLAYVLSHFIFFFLLGLTHLDGVLSPHENKGNCVAVAVLIHFMGLTTACWLSIINFDLWWTFKVLKPRTGDKLDVWRFVWYNFFALGVPALIVSIALGIQSSEPEFVCRSETGVKRAISPEYASNRSCAMTDEARPAYWFGPLIFLLVANLVFFLITTRRMVSLQRMTRRASIESSNGQSQSRQIFVKIFIVSGVAWWVEIIQWIIGYFHKGDSSAWYYSLLDMFHFIQAIAIFAIFVCKREVIRSLQMKYPTLTQVIPPVYPLQRSMGPASVSTDVNSRSGRLNYKLNGRKTSSVSTTSSIDGGKYFQRQESFENSPAPPTPLTSAPPAVTFAIPPSISNSKPLSRTNSNPNPDDQSHVTASSKPARALERKGQYVERRHTTDPSVSMESISLDDSER